MPKWSSSPVLAMNMAAGLPEFLLEGLMSRAQAGFSFFPLQETRAGYESRRKWSMGLLSVGDFFDSFIHTQKVEDYVLVFRFHRTGFEFTTFNR